jgi:hypothetical protein
MEELGEDWKWGKSALAAAMRTDDDEDEEQEDDDRASDASAAGLLQQSSITRMTRTLFHQTNIVPYLLLSPSWSSASSSGANSG